MGRRADTRLGMLSSALFGTARSRWLAVVFSAVATILLGYLWYKAQRIERVSNPLGPKPQETSLGQPPSADAPEVLVLNSYHPGYSWSDNELEGILTVLRRSRPEPRVSVEYLDTKRHGEMAHFDALKQLMLRKQDGRRPPAVVIAADNPALEFAKAYRAELFPAAAIVFCGVNGFTPSMTAGQANVTGVAEVVDAGKTLEVALRLHPRTRSVLVLHDYSLTGLATRRESEEQLRPWEHRVRISYLENLPLDELLARVRAAPADSIVLSLSYSLDRGGRPISHEQIARLLSDNAAVPVYGVHEERLGYGIVGGSLTGGLKQGSRAGELAARILGGESASAIPIDTSPQSRLMFDWRQLERFEVSSGSLPPGAIVVNRPVPFFVLYRGLVGTTLALILLLVGGIAALGLSILRRQQAEKALSESERSFRALFESAADAIFIEDESGGLLDANAEALRLLGCAREQLKRTPLRDFISEKHRQSLEGRDKDLASLQRAVLACDMVSKDGRVIPVEMSARTIEHFGERGVLTIARDISERKKSEEEREKLFAQLLQAQKMESIGRLAGGVAHDFNNVLTSIFGYCDLLLLSLRPADPNRASVKVIRSAAEKAADLTRQLLAFSRKQLLETRPIDLNDTIEEFRKILGRVIGDDVRLDFKPGKIDRILADQAQLEQVLMNLVVNARDAMPNGGTLVVETQLVQLQQGDPLEAIEQAPRSYVMLAVSDTGVGMRPEVREQIFEPFFTTKEVGKGTGLGLATVYGIVKQHGGLIHVYSEPGIGSTFKVYFPATSQPVQEKSAPVSGRVSGGGEKLLVVDDDAAIVDVVTRTLAPLGYDVMSTTSSPEALRMATSLDGTIDLLLTDVVMRDMSGKQLATSIQQNRPTVKVVFMSGYTGKLLALEELMNDGSTLLQKPFTPRALAEVVRKVLDSPSG